MSTFDWSLTLCCSTAFTFALGYLVAKTHPTAIERQIEQGRRLWAEALAKSLQDAMSHVPYDVGDSIIRRLEEARTK